MRVACRRTSRNIVAERKLSIGSGGVSAVLVARRVWYCGEALYL